jgi:TolA-binding protein
VRLSEQFAGKFPDSPLRLDVEAMKGRALAALGRHAEAAAALERSLDAEPDRARGLTDSKTAEAAGSTSNRAQARADLALAYARLGRLADARRVVTALVDQKAPDALAAETAYQVAELAFAAGELETALTLYSLLARPGNSPESLRRGFAGVGWCRFQASDWRGAAAAFEQLLNQFPDSPAAAEAAIARGRALEHLDDNALALAMYRRVIDRHAASPRSAEALYRAARLCEKLGQRPQAMELYARLVKEHADFAQLDAAIYAWAWLARASSQGVADELFGRLRRDFPQSEFAPDATLQLAERAFADKKYAEAQQLLAEISKPGTPQAVREPALYLQGRVAAATGDWTAVDAKLAELIADAPAGELAPAAAYLRAEASYRRGDFDEAAKRLAELTANDDLRSQPWAGPAKLRHAQALAQLRRWDEALETARSIAAEFPDFDERHEVDYVIGRCLAAQADFSGAREAYERVVASSRGGQSETAAMARWMIGETYFHQENYTAALAEYEKAAQGYPFPHWQSAALLQVGKCHELLAQWGEAVRAYERLLKEFPQSELAAEATDRAEAARQHLAGRSPPPKQSRRERGVSPHRSKVS